MWEGGPALLGPLGVALGRTCRKVCKLGPCSGFMEKPPHMHTHTHANTHDCAEAR